MEDVTKLRGNAKFRGVKAKFGGGAYVGPTLNHKKRSKVNAQSKP